MRKSLINNHNLNKAIKIQKMSTKNITVRVSKMIKNIIIK
jgi:hypothetical protein